MKNIALVLSGCGFLDGAEITESVSCLIALSELGVKVSCFAPEQDFPTTNHINQQSESPRACLAESARITRGDIKSLEKLNVDDFDAIVFPGGFGAAKNLCSWATRGSKATVLPQLQTVVMEFHQQSKPIGAACIAPALIALVLGDFDVTLTIGDDTETASEIEKTGAQHENCAVDDYITDRANKVVSTPAYMYDKPAPHLVFQGIRGMIKELVEMA